MDPELVLNLSTTITCTCPPSSPSYQYQSSPFPLWQDIHEPLSLNAAHLRLSRPSETMPRPPATIVAPSPNAKYLHLWWCFSKQIELYNSTGATRTSTQELIQSKTLAGHNVLAG